MKTDAFGAYQRYLALRLHFTSNYDALKYNFKVRADYEKFKNKPEAYWFNKLSERFTVDELTNAFVSNFIAGKKWGGMHDPTFDATYTAWLGRIETLTYTFTNDLETIRNASGETLLLADLFITDPSQLPPVVMLWHRKKVSLETVTALDKLTKFSVKSQCTSVLWPGDKQLIQKYGPFLQIDVPKFKEILLDHFPIGVRSGQDLAQEQA